MERKEKLYRFLMELTALTKKYDIAIKGCGCCGSPWLEDYEYSKSYDNLTINHDGEYEVDE